MRLLDPFQEGLYFFVPVPVELGFLGGLGELLSNCPALGLQLAVGFADDLYLVGLLQKYLLQLVGVALAVPLRAASYGR